MVSPPQDDRHTKKNNIVTSMHHPALLIILDTVFCHFCGVILKNQGRAKKNRQWLSTVIFLTLEDVYEDRCVTDTTLNDTTQSCMHSGLEI